MSPAVLPRPPMQGVAEAELEKDIGRTLKVLIRSMRQEVGLELRAGLGDLAAWYSSPYPPKRVQGWLCSGPQ